MSYPDLPANRLIVDGVDLTTTFDMILSDGYSLAPPTIKTYTIDIPGGNGTLDLTESLLGDTAYGNRKQEFTFYLVNQSNFEATKTLISNRFHGRAFDYTMTMDPGYTYHGRFQITSYEHSPSSMGIIGAIRVSVDSDPFKHKPLQVRLINAVGGRISTFDSGRKRVRPSFETNRLLKVIHDNKLVYLPVGTWTISDLFFTVGTNVVYLCSYDVRNLTWKNLKDNGTTWGAFGEQPLFEWYKSQGNLTYTYRTWDDMSSNTWGELSSSTWADMFYLTGIPADVDDIYVSYEWGDL